MHRILQPGPASSSCAQTREGSFIVPVLDTPFRKTELAHYLDVTRYEIDDVGHTTGAHSCSKIIRRAENRVLYPRWPFSFLEIRANFFMQRWNPFRKWYEVRLVSRAFKCSTRWPIILDLAFVDFTWLRPTLFFIWVICIPRGILRASYFEMGYRTCFFTTLLGYISDRNYYFSLRNCMSSRSEKKKKKATLPAEFSTVCIRWIKKFC